MSDNVVILLALVSIIILMGTAVGSIVINEVELNPPGDERTRLTQSTQWVELFNNGEDANIGGWMVSTSEGRSVTIPRGTIIPAYGYYIVSKASQWLAHTNETLALYDDKDVEVDRTPSLSDTSDDEFAWTRDPDGRDTNSSSDWKFLASSSGF